MIEIFIVYCLFIYLLSIGMLYQYSKDLKKGEPFIMLAIVQLSLAPLVTPIIIGMLITDSRVE